MDHYKQTSPSPSAFPLPTWTLWCSWTSLLHRAVVEASYSASCAAIASFFCEVACWGFTIVYLLFFVWDLKNDTCVFYLQPTVVLEKTVNLLHEHHNAWLFSAHWPRWLKILQAGSNLSINVEPGLLPQALWLHGYMITYTILIQELNCRAHQMHKWLCIYRMRAGRTLLFKIVSPIYHIAHL